LIFLRVNRSINEIHKHRAINAIDAIGVVYKSMYLFITDIFFVQSFVILNKCKFVRNWPFKENLLYCTTVYRLLKIKYFSQTFC
jgi:hypothetical protein